MSLLSVLLPYRDAATTIDEALTSLIDQRGLPVDLEIIAIDDGSQDDGPGRVAALSGRLEAAAGGTGAAGGRVRVVSLATGGVGVAHALAAGLDVATGEWIGRMDADDVSHPDRFARQIEALSADPTLAAVGCLVEPFTGVDAEVSAGLARYVAWQNGLVTAEDHARQIFVESPLCHPSVLLWRAALEAVGGWRDTPWPEDYDLWLRLDAAGWRMAKVPEILFRWRHRPDRVTFTDPRCTPERLLEAKAPHLARRLVTLDRPVAIWGAGKTGKRLARALEAQRVPATRFFDIDPQKIGGQARGVPVADAAELLRDAESSSAGLGSRSPWTIVVAVGEPGARDIVRARLDAAGFVEGTDYLCGA